MYSVLWLLSSDLSCSENLPVGNNCAVTGPVPGPWDSSCNTLSVVSSCQKENKITDESIRSGKQSAPCKTPVSNPSKTQ
jgi:hypothetical protein